MPSETSREISQRIRAQLKILDPELSAEPLTPERKIIDTVSEVIAESNASTYILQYQYDIDAKTGTDLDRFVALFGFGRKGGIRSTGTVTFRKLTVAKNNVFIPARSQVIKPSTTVSPAVVFRTIIPATLYKGTTEVEVPVECVTLGEIGNVPANTITELGFQNNEISEVTNENSTSGGSNAETDAELRVRFKNTIFRNISGTQDQYLALSIASKFAKKANVIGPISRYVEYLQVESDLTIASQIPYSKFTYDHDYYLTDASLIDEHFYSPESQDYTFNQNNGSDPVQPTIDVDNTTSLPVNSVVLLEHSYCSRNSRNDPENNFFNSIDIYVSGDDIQSALESLQFPGSGSQFVDNTASKFHHENYKRMDTNGTVAIGNKFQILLWQPMADLPDSIAINNVTYFKNTHYWAVKDVTNYRGSRRGRNGIEWKSTVAVTEGTDYVLTYSFNRLPITMNELIDGHKPVGADVLVHQANKRYFNINLIIMYSAGFSAQSVEIALKARMQQMLEELQFGATIQISDLVEAAHEVPGVDNVRLATASDGVSYGVQEIAADGITQIDYPTIQDFILQDSDLPVLNQVIAHRRSQNTWTP